MSEPITAPRSSRIFRAAIWVAIGALIAAAIVCVVWVIIGDSNGIVERAFLTILLLVAFAGIAILESSLSDRRPAWFALVSMVSWVVALLIGAFMIWMPEADDAFGIGAERFFKFLLILLILQGAILHIRLFAKAFARYQTTFTSIVTYVTMGLVVILALMLVLSLMLSEFVDFRDIYWRVVVSLAILAAVGTALVPLVNALFAPKRPRPAVSAYASASYPSQQQYPSAQQYPAAQQYPSQQHPASPQAPYGQAPQWPTYADGRTPLPVLPDGAPDWNAYYTGWPTYPQQASAATPEPPSTPSAPQAPAAPERPAPPVPPLPGTPDVPPAPPAPPQH